MIKKIRGWVIGAILSCVLSCFALTASAQPVTILWDAPLDAVLYNVYFKVGEGEYSKETSSSTIETEYTFEFNVDGKYSFVVTAEDKYGNESVYSNEVSTVVDTTPPLAPAIMLKIE